MILFLIAIVPVLIFNRVTKSWSDRLAVDSPNALLGFWVQVVTALIALLLLMAVRLWFDMAQARIVVEDERAVRKALWPALKLTLRRSSSHKVSCFSGSGRASGSGQAKSSGICGTPPRLQIIFLKSPLSVVPPPRLRAKARSR